MEADHLIAAFATTQCIDKFMSLLNVFTKIQKCLWHQFYVCSRPLMPLCPKRKLHSVGYLFGSSGKRSSSSSWDTITGVTRLREHGAVIHVVANIYQSVQRQNRQYRTFPINNWDQFFIQGNEALSDAWRHQSFNISVLDAVRLIWHLIISYQSR